MKPKHIILLLAVSLFAMRNKEKVVNPDKAISPNQPFKFASIPGKWLLRGVNYNAHFYTASVRFFTPQFITNTFC